MNLQPIYGKLIQVHLWEGWSRNAIGIVQPSVLGEELLCIMPVPPENPMLKELQIESVARPLHIKLSDVSGIFELEYGKENKES